MYRNIYDNWERLMGAVLKREQLRQLALADSSESSSSSSLSSISASAGSSTPTPAGTSHNPSNAAGLLTTSSSAGFSQFSEATSEEMCLAGEILPRSNLMAFTFADMKNATENFRSDMVLGIGNFGTVFKGWVDAKTLAPSKDGIGVMVAIKKLNPESTQGYEDWESKINFLGRLSHPILIKLLGYCWEDKELLLVYEYTHWGSLDNLHFRRSGFSWDIWDIRLKIALGAARGLFFLHSSVKKVIYRDISTFNILLEGNYNAKISDFDLAKLRPSEAYPQIATRVLGTYCYAAPEYVATGCLYVKSDVYGFGMVLLGMLIGLRVYDKERPSGRVNLVEFAKPLLHKRNLLTLMDLRWKGQYSSKAAMQAAKITLRCLELEPTKRPSMKEVVEALEQVADIQRPK